MRASVIFFSLLFFVMAWAGNGRASLIVESSGFNAVHSAAINTAGLVDWGYVDTQSGFFNGTPPYNNTPFDQVYSGSPGNTITTVKGPSSTNGTVTLTEGAGTDVIAGQTNIPHYTFDGSQAYGAFGNFGPTEQDVWTITFNDLGVGTFEISLYLGHSNTGRSFDMDVSGTGLASFTDNLSPLSSLGSTVAAYGSSGSAFTYDIVVTTTAASDDLTLTHGGTGGSFGGAILSGYTIAIPEPSTTSALALLGAISCFIRRRRRRG